MIDRPSVSMELCAPSLLIAVPQLGDPNFRRSVILLVEHDGNGTMGLVLNRAEELTMGALCGAQGLPFNGDISQPVFQGGPVEQQRAFILHDGEQLGPETEEIIDGVSISYSLESLGNLAKEPPEHQRVFIGYAGWGPDQLTEEMRHGAWLLCNADARLVLGTPQEDLWKEALACLGIQPAQLLHSDMMH